MELDNYALVIIDLQQRIVSRETWPHPAAAVVARTVQLAAAFRHAGRPVVAVRTINLDAPDVAGDQVVADVRTFAGDLIVTKHTWGAFHGTSLDLHLRRLSVSGLVLAGLMTNFGVESTARAADEHGYALVFAEDAMASVSADAHAFAVETIFPLLGTMTTSAAILAELVRAEASVSSRPEEG